MKYVFRIAGALITFSIGVGITFLCLRVLSGPGNIVDDRIPVGDVKGQVTFQFSECAGQRAVFLLNNGKDHRIFARVQRADFWQEFKEADLEYGVHIIQYRAPGAKDFVDVSNQFDAVEPFQTIMPQETIRYGVDLRMGPGEYLVKVPYMEDAEVARKLEEEFPKFLKENFERVKASWIEATAGVVSNTCR